MARRKRIKLSGATAYYHLMSRTVNGEKWFGDREKEVLRKMIGRVATFSGIRVVTYAVMDNHFHVLAEVPDEREIGDRELVRRFKALYPKPTVWQPLSPEGLEKILQTGGREAVDVRTSLLRRMHDVSWFMKTVKQRFSIWFNQSRKRFGPVWSGRFKSTVVEGEKFSLRTVAAYIDLNAVRAGVVADPKDYRFCGYAEAVAGHGKARENLRVVDKTLAGYRTTLFGAGSDARENKATISRAEALRVLNEEKGKLPLPTLLRCRVRYFNDGLALGSPSFVASVASSINATMSRKRPARPHQPEGSDWRGMTVLAGVNKNVFG